MGAQTVRDEPAAVAPTVADQSASQSWASRPSVHLVYLIFYFFPWLFQSPRPIDIVVGVIAVAVFLPIYYRAHRGDTTRDVRWIIAIQAIAVATTPFLGMSGTYYIYACAQAGFQRPVKRAIVMMLALTLVHVVTVTAVYLGLDILDKAWPNIFIALLIGGMVGLSCIASAEQMEGEKLLRRMHVIERQRAALAERERIAHDLHDLLGHTLTMVALKAEVAARFLDDTPARARREIEEIRDEARAALADVRAAVTGLAETTAEAETTRAKEALAAAGVTLRIEGDPPVLDPRRSAVVGLAIREAATNIVRHAHATNAVVRFDHETERLTVTIKDDGRGAPTGVAEGSGLAGLRKRVAGVGGEVGVDFSSGARLTLAIPRARPAAEPATGAAE